MGKREPLAMAMATRVLFVCMGNICRSPMAHGVFRHQVRQAGLESVVGGGSTRTTPGRGTSRSRSAPGE